MASAVKKADKRALYVGGLDKQVTEQILFTAFVPFGPIKGVQIAMDYATQRSKGFGFIEFVDEMDARAAIDNMDVWAEADEAMDVWQPIQPHMLMATINKPGRLLSTAAAASAQKLTQEIHRRKLPCHLLFSCSGQ
uniref:RRM domain-containing protein n=1 Tax=Hyaloperonospora arabidopsidis (strain Emoy2) TaxID=559515 RepID=M4BJR5_HYAAE